MDGIHNVLHQVFQIAVDDDMIRGNPADNMMKELKLSRGTDSEKRSALTMEQEKLFFDYLKRTPRYEHWYPVFYVMANTGMRVGELVKLNRADIDFQNRECVVLGKGNRQRKVYFDARTKIHLKKYLDSRCDDNDALFVSLQKPYKRLQISGVEIRLRELGRKLNLSKVHPHKFRRTLATMAIDKGMPIEQVQQLLGHQSVDTTLQYAMVNQNNVKASHKKYIG